MDTNTAISLLPLLISAFVVFGWWNWQRQAARADEDEREAKKAHDNRLTLIEREQQRLALELEKRVTREEFERVFKAIEEVRESSQDASNRVLDMLVNLVSGKPPRPGGLG